MLRCGTCESTKEVKLRLEQSEQAPLSLEDEAEQLAATYTLDQLLHIVELSLQKQPTLRSMLVQRMELTHMELATRDALVCESTPVLQNLGATLDAAVDKSPSRPEVSPTPIAAAPPCASPASLGPRAAAADASAAVAPADGPLQRSPAAAKSPSPPSAPSAVNGVAEAVGAFKSTKAEPDVEQIRGRRQAQDDEDSTSVLPIVQFATSVFYTNEEEKEVVLDLKKVGDPSAACSVSYKTIDGSACAGIKYRAVEGVIEFKPWEQEKEIRVAIIHDEAWDSTQEFKVQLSSPEGAVLGRYLYRCRVKIIDNSCFPTDKYSDIIESRRYSELPKIGLLRELVKMFMSDKTIRYPTIAMVVIDQMKNLVLVLFFCTKLYLLNSVTDATDPDAILLPLGGVVVFLVSLRLALFFADMQKKMLGFGGKCRSKLQVNLVRKFLNYRQEERRTLRDSDVVMAVTTDSVCTVAYSYFLVFDLFRVVTTFLWLFCFQTIVAAQQDGSYGVLGVSLSAHGVFPLVMVMFLRRRHRITTAVYGQRDEERNALASIVETTVRSYELIAGYQRRPEAVEACEEKVKRFNEAILAQDTVDSQNVHFGQIMTTVIIGGYIVYGGREVVLGRLSVGAYMTGIDTFKRVGDGWGSVYQMALTIFANFNSMERIIKYMNLPIDLHERLAMDRKRRLEGRTQEQSEIERIKKRSSSVHSVNAQVAVLVDRIHVQLNDVAFRYAPLNSSGIDNPSLNPFKIAKWNLTLEQGTVVALVGLPGSGKSTLLKLLCGINTPTEGEVFVPPHLRVVFVAQQPMFVHASLFDNLTMGADKDSTDCDRERVLSICRRLRVPEEVIALMDLSNGVVLDDHLSMSTKYRLHLARSFISNPELLIMDKPTLPYDDDGALGVLNTMRSFVDERGVDIVAPIGALHSDKLHRRVRTCIFTAVRQKGLQMADMVFAVSREKISAVESASCVSDAQLK